jgi:predicted O-methyltransferase YrrM
MSVYQAKKYLQYKVRAKDEHALHSPFVFSLYTEVIRNVTAFYAYEEVDAIRKRLLADTHEIEVTDLGAGSRKLGSKRKISDIARYSVVNKKYGELLFRLANHFKPLHVIELGTSLGISALYLSKAAPKAEIISIEGCPQTASFAQKLLQSENAQNVTVINSEFETAFEKQLREIFFDFVYIDGNHTYEATKNYFTSLLTKTNENSILVFDDIYWSEGMTQAWEEIKAHPSVTVSIDLFKFGLIFFRKENKQKENFCLKL